MFPGNVRLRFPLTRRNRLALTRRGYRWRFYAIPTLLVALSILISMVSSVFFVLLFFALIIYRRLVLDLIDIAIMHIRIEDVFIQESALGFISAGSRWWVFHDGLMDMKQFVNGFWTIRHYNGTVLHIPASMVSEAHIDYLKDRVKRSRKAAAECCIGSAAEVR